MFTLPKTVKNKIGKTAQTRGADDDSIYQNRVKRNGTVLIPFSVWKKWEYLRLEKYDNGYIVLVSPSEVAELLAYPELSLGINCLVFYQTREEWERFSPDSYGWQIANARYSNEPPYLGGEYVARVPGLPKEEKSTIREGYMSAKLKGAGIRFFEYACERHIKECLLQLECLFNFCYDVKSFLASSEEYDEKAYAEYLLRITSTANMQGLLDHSILRKHRIINTENELICPLCLERISAFNFAKTIQQAEGRDVPDMTVTEVNLFHIDELKVNSFNHRPYNLGWGHHHCNVVVKDNGIENTLRWMQAVLERNERYGLGE